MNIFDLVEVEKIDRHVPFNNEDVEFLKKFKLMNRFPKLYAGKYLWKGKDFELRVIRTWLHYYIGITYKNADGVLVIEKDVGISIPNAKSGNADWWKEKPTANISVLKAGLLSAENRLKSRIEITEALEEYYYGEKNDTR